MCTCNLYQIKFISVYFFLVCTSSANAHSLTDTVYLLATVLCHCQRLSVCGCAHTHLQQYSMRQHFTFRAFEFPFLLFSYSSYILIIFINFKANPNHGIICISVCISLNRTLKISFLKIPILFITKKYLFEMSFLKNLESGSKQSTHCSWLLCLFSPPVTFLNTEFQSYNKVTFLNMKFQAFNKGNYKHAYTYHLKKVLFCYTLSSVHPLVCFLYACQSCKYI